MSSRQLQALLGEMSITELLNGRTHKQCGVTAFDDSSTIIDWNDSLRAPLQIQEQDEEHIPN